MTWTKARAATTDSAINLETRVCVYKQKKIVRANISLPYMSPGARGGTVVPFGAPTEPLLAQAPIDWCTLMVPAPVIPPLSGLSLHGAKPAASGITGGADTGLCPLFLTSGLLLTGATPSGVCAALTPRLLLGRILPAERVRETEERDETACTPLPPAVLARPAPSPPMEP